MNRNARWVWLVAGTAVLGAALVLAFVLSLTSPTEGFYERNFVWLFWLNAAVAGLLFVVIAVALARLVLRQRRGKFGTRLLTKLAGIFALVGLLPGLVIYTVSYQFVSRSIEIWFDVKVATALDAGLALGKGTLETLVADLGERTRLAAERLGDERTALTPLSLERLRERLDVRDLSLVGGNGQILLSAGGGANAGLPERPGADALRQARQLRVFSQIEGLDEEQLAAGGQANPRVRAVALIRDTEISLNPGEARFLVAVQPVPRQLAANALAVQSAYSEYQQRALARNGLRRMYIGTLTLALVLSVFGAVLLAALLGNQLVRPLILLADGVRQVAAGDLSNKRVFASRDELGGLTRSFADMTAQLAEAREDVQRGVSQLESARTRLQTILDNLTAGVVVFDRDGRIDTVNPGATRILRLPLSVYRGRRLDEVPEIADFARSVWQRFELHASSPEAGERDHWQEAFELRPGERDTQMLLVRGALLPDDSAQVAGEPSPTAEGEAAPVDGRAAPSARLMVFDDITEVVSAQRSAAWSEVARRLAHEIKNPLTPIQLSAERLQHKLQPKLAGSDAALLVRSVETIVNQVQAMKQLVNEFRDYARLPAAQLNPLDLNALVTEVLGLYGEPQEKGRLKAELAEALPPILGDATQLRQVVHNLVQNALDAVAEQDAGQVRVSTSAARGEHGELRAVRLTVIDNGPGFADNVLQRAFEPYITTKSKGTGLGLAVVKKIADEHRATVRIANLRGPETADGGGREVRGARVSLSFSSFLPAPGSAAADGESMQAH
ncbi:MAG: HAMP domain-containing protein [Rubrivivax sp.]|nr:HAMP domain-containing protein [Rubrivivax sp.]